MALRAGSGGAAIMIRPEGAKVEVLGYPASVTATSMAVLNAAANARRVPLWRHLAGEANVTLPLPENLAKSQAGYALFIFGGLIIFWAERRQHHVRVPSVDDMTLKDALMLGCIQALALIPGASTPLEAMVAI